MQLHDARVVTLVLGFLDHVAPPARHRVEHTDGADTEDDRRSREHVVHPGDRADRHDEGGDGADDGPWRRIDQVVVVMLALRGSHLRSLSSIPCLSGTYPLVSNP